MIDRAWTEYEPAEPFLEAHRAQDRTMAAMARDVGITYAHLMERFGKWPKWQTHKPTKETIIRFHGAN